MFIDTVTTTDLQPATREVYELYLGQRRIIRDFFLLLPETQYDFQISPRSSTPRWCLAHILDLQLVWLDALRTGELRFRAMGVDVTASKDVLLKRMDEIEAALFEIVQASTFAATDVVTTEWGKQLTKSSAILAIREHDVLHIGWNDAFMDFIEMPRYDSLRAYWG